MADNKSSGEGNAYVTSEVDAVRAIEQGLGVGQRDLDAQFEPPVPDGADQYDFDGADNPQEDGGPASGGAQQGASRTKLAGKTRIAGQGRKTVEKNREQFRGGHALR